MNYLKDLLKFNFLYSQADIGLRKFETKDLFLNLLYPTLVVIVTVVQLQIVHKNYLKTLYLPPAATQM